MAGSEQLPVVTIPSDLTTPEQVQDFIHQAITRRSFTKIMGAAGLGAVAFQFGCASSTKDEVSRPVYVANSQGMVVSDPALCVGCRRCESACVGFRKGGEARPAVSNIKVNRNLLYGVEGIYVGARGDGLYGSFRVVQDTCRQCAHPVPCQLACPNAAIEVIPPVNARVVNTEKCQGCGICVNACPWEMASLDGKPEAIGTKSTKCTLCDGAPECVEACPAGALKYVPWIDRTSDVPRRQSGTGVLASDVKDSCKNCH